LLMIDLSFVNLFALYAEAHTKYNPVNIT
jgi:hypothetical protein